MYRDSEPSLTDQKNVKEYIFVSFFFKKKTWQVLRSSFKQS